MITAKTVTNMQMIQLFINTASAEISQKCEEEINAILFQSANSNSNLGLNPGEMYELSTLR
jgi:hypothetical protein